MIPKVIHYCWFGKNKLSDDAIRCKNSWKKFFPDYEIKEWNENNFDIEICKYVKEAYECKKWAFVSDYARFWILYNYGGLYFDTDVEIIAPMNDIVEKGPFMGCEMIESLGIGVNPGLGIGVNSGMRLYEEILEAYENEHFISTDGNINLENIVVKTTRILKRYGFKGNNTIEYICGVYIYPVEYFCPKNYYTGEIILTRNTRTIHHYSSSWLSKYELMAHNILKSKSKNRLEYVGRYTIAILFKVIGLINKYGIRGSCKYILNKYKR